MIVNGYMSDEQEYFWMATTLDQQAKEFSGTVTYEF